MQRTPTHAMAPATRRPGLDPILVMGVSAAGKSTLGRALAHRLGRPFVEGDELHPERNRRRMAEGRPLTDEMRADWLDRLAEAVARSHGHPVFACSGLKRRYRDRLRRRLGPLSIVWLTGSHARLAGRIARREGHFFPAHLLASQLATLQPPRGEPRVLELDIALSVSEQVRRAVHRFG